MNIKSTILNNGVKLYTDLNKNVNTVIISFVVHTGSFGEEENEHGLAHFTEHMLFKGTVNRTATEISNSIEKVGGLFDACTFFNFTKYYCVLPYDKYECGLDILSDIIWNNTIPEEEFDMEKQVILEEIKMYMDNPSDLALDELMGVMNKQYPNRQSISGTIEDVSNITREQMINFINKYYIPKNISIVVTGNFDENKVIDFLNNYSDIDYNYDNLILKDDNFVANFDNSDELIITKGNEQSIISFGVFCPPASDLEHYVGQVFSVMLGGNCSSKLHVEIREKRGLAYRASCDIFTLKDIGVIEGIIGTSENNIDKVKHIIQKEINNFQNGNFENKLLEDAKSYIIGQRMLSMDNCNCVNEYLCDEIINDYSINENDYINIINKVTKQDIINFANKYLNGIYYVIVK